MGKRDGAGAVFEPMEDFGDIVSGYAAGFRARGAIKGSEGGVGKAGEATRRAWGELVGPGSIVLAALMDASKEPDCNLFMGVRLSGEGLPAREERADYREMQWMDDEEAREGRALDVVGLGYSEEALRTIAEGLSELAMDVEEAAAGDAFKAAARAWAPLLVAEGSDGILSYPLLGAALRPAKVVHEGVKRDAAVGVKTPKGTAGDMARLLDGEEALHAQRVGRAVEAVEGVWNDSNAHDLFMGKASQEEGTRPIMGDAQLPSTRSYASPWGAGVKVGSAVAQWGVRRLRGAPWGSKDHMEQAAEVELGLVSMAALDAMAMVLSPKAAQAAPQELASKWGLLAGPLAQARGEFGQGTEVPVREALDAALALAKGIEAVDEEEALFMVASRPPGRDFTEAELRMYAIKTLAKPGMFEAAVREAAKERPKGPLSKNCGNLRSPSRFEAEGGGFEGLAALMGRADPRLGLAQWAARAIQTVGKYGEFGGGGRRFDRSGGRADLLDGLGKFSAALSKARALFVDEALAAAKGVEARWLERNGLLGIWRQASASGQLTSKSLAWAAATPVSASLSSPDPMARLAASSARALGLAAGGDAELRAGMEQALGEMGADGAALALLEGNESAREALGKLFAGSVAKDRRAAQASRLAAEVACKAATAAAARGLRGESATRFMESLADPGRFLNGKVDALNRGFMPTVVGGAKAARLVSELAAAKELHQPALYRALAKDWDEAVEAGLAAGKDGAEALKGAAERLGRMAAAMPAGLAIDWRSRPFDAMPAWEAFGVESPRLEAACALASAEGGLAAWCAGVASELGVLDAQGPNDLIGRCKERVRARLGVGEGAWKTAIKSTQALACVEQALLGGGADWRRGFQARGARLAGSAMVGEGELEETGTRRDPSGAVEGAESRVGMALAAAAAIGASPESVGAALTALASREDGKALFSSTIDEMTIEDHEGALSYAREAVAKASRAARIFQEACRRHAKLAADRMRASPEVRALMADPDEALAGEAADLRDWLSASEHGIWQQLPQEPTWGQLTRLSRAWHEEEAAKAADEASRREARFGAQREKWKLAPFAARSSEHWEPIVGTVSNGEWTAVELTCQGELSEEGKAMSHCVSGYAPQCRSGELRIFSVRLSGERKCTVELRADEGRLGGLGEHAKFKITQNKGRHNAAVVHAATKAFCEEVRVAVEAGWSEKWRSTQALVEKDRRAKAEKAALARARGKVGADDDAPDGGVVEAAGVKRRAKNG